MNDVVPATARPRRRFRLTLGVMMALVLAIGGSLGWVAHGTRVQRDAVAAILKENRGSVRFDWQVVENGKRVDRTPKGPKWLRDAVGPDVFDTVTFVGLDGEKLDDGLMAQVAMLDRAESLNIGGRLSAALTLGGMNQIRHLSRLRSLTVRGYSLNSPVGADPQGFVPALRGRAGMIRLSIMEAHLTDRDMETIGQMTVLEELAGDGRAVTDTGFARLGGLKQLKTIELRNVHICTLAPLEGMAELQTLRLNQAADVLRLDRVGDAPRNLPEIRLAPLRGAMKLQAIGLDNPVNDEDLEELRNHPKLSEVRLAGAGITQAGLRVLSTLPAMSSLSLRDVSAHDLRPLGSVLPRLIYLDLAGSAIDDDGLRAVTKAVGLRDLLLDRTRITDAGLGSLSSLPILQRLWLNETAITDAGLARLVSVRRLGFLSLDRTRITDAGLAHLAAMPGLRSVCLCDTTVTDEGLAHLSRLPSLSNLVLNESVLTDAGISHLAKLPSLRSLHFAGAGPSDATRVRLAKALPRIAMRPGLDR